MIGSVKHIFEGYDIGMFKRLMDFYFVVKEVNVSHVHILQFDDFDGETLVFVIVPNATVDATAETTTYQMLKVEAVPTYSFLSLERQLRPWEVVMGFLGVAGFDVERAVSAAQLIRLGRYGDGDGD